MITSNYRGLRSITWYQNIQPSYGEPLTLTATYDPSIHRTYDNLDAINVDKVKDIPKDYYGVMGVPITFITNSHYDHKQFELVDVYGSNNLISGKKIFKRIAIRRKEK